MATVLYITAHPLETSASFSLTAGEAFIEAYREANPSDEVLRVDLFKEFIPQIDADVLGGWGKLQSGTSFDQLSEDAQKKIARLGQLVEQFVAADKYVFVNPMWNFSFPPVLKAYVDAICVAGKTFKYTEQGPVGLLTDKKVFHIQANGGIYSEGPAATVENGSRYLATIMQFFGVPSFESLFVEGHAMMPNKAAEIKQNGIARAQEAGKRF